MKDKSNRITVANIIAVIGIVVLAAGLFLGYLYSGDNMGISGIKAAGWALGFTFLLWFLIKAKGAVNELGKWRIVEISTLVVYLALAVISSIPMSRFFNIYVANSDLRDAATADIETMNDGIRQFQDDANSALDVTLRGLRNAADNDISVTLSNYLMEQNFDALDGSSINAFANGTGGWRGKIESITLDGQDYVEAWNDELDRCRTTIESWNVLEIPQAVQSLSDVSDEISQTLTDLSAELPFPVIERHAATEEYTIVSRYEPSTYDFAPNVVSKLNGIKATGLVGIVICAFIHLLILFNYLVAYRSDKIRPTRRSNAAGGQGIMLNQ